MSAARGADHGFDVVVIGSGPAGQKAAMHAAQCGKRVAVIERDRHVGGSCVYSGAIPSKATSAFSGSGDLTAANAIALAVAVVAAAVTLGVQRER